MAIFVEEQERGRMSMWRALHNKHIRLLLQYCNTSRDLWATPTDRLHATYIHARTCTCTCTCITTAVPALRCAPCSTTLTRVEFFMQLQTLVGLVAAFALLVVALLAAAALALRLRVRTAPCS